MSAPVVKTGTDRLAGGDGPQLRARPVSVLCHPATVDSRLRHIVEILRDRGADVVSLLGPEHGLDAAAQDMEGVGREQSSGRAMTGPPVYSLYGEDIASLRPSPSMFHGAEWLICDLQDVGCRYYTYVWTICMAAEVALAAGLHVLLLDRPNPLGGLESQVEGGHIEAGQESFVGWHDVSVRHGMTVAELAMMTLTERGVAGLERVEVLECSGWRRSMEFEATGLPWVLPSPNMPTMDTARVYAGQCLVEGTQLSEGRGTTRPFEVMGAPFIDGRRLVESVAVDDCPGVRLRPLTFKPMFQKHAGIACGGVQLHIWDRTALRSLRTSWALLAAIWRLWPGAAKWRTETYEFVSDRPAIDMLAGGSGLRLAIEAGVRAHELVAACEPQRQQFLQRRRAFLRYPE